MKSHLSDVYVALLDFHIALSEILAYISLLYYRYYN